jgi:glutamine amidotransferase
MCRLLALVGKGLGDYSKYIDAFAEASRCDPYLTEFSDSKTCRSHDDGWGYAVVGVDEGGKSVSQHYRTTLPVFHDHEGLSHLKNLLRRYSLMSVIAHSRKLAEGSARVVNTHPLHFSWKGFEMWLAHNGLMDSEALSRDLGIGRITDITDTFYLGEYIYRALSGVSTRELVEALKNVARYTKSAMNTLIILYDDSRIITSISFYLTESRMNNPTAFKYYKILTENFGELHTFFSSSLQHYLSREKVEELPPQTVAVVEIDLKTASKKSLLIEALPS